MFQIIAAIKGFEKGKSNLNDQATLTAKYDLHGFCRQTTGTLEWTTSSMITAIKRQIEVLDEAIALLQLHLA